MRLHTKLMGTAVLTLLMPMAALMILYFIVLFPLGVGQLKDIDYVPPIVMADLARILEGERPVKGEKDLRSVVAVMYQGEGVIYSSPDLDADFQFDPANPVPADFQPLPVDSLVGVSRFQNGDKTGVVLYLVRTALPLRWLSSNVLRFLSFILIFMLLVPSILSWMFLSGLRKELMQLENAAARVALGNLDTELAIPRDEAIAPVFQSFEDMRRMLNESNEHRHRFLLAISHDLKSPLTGIIGYVEAMQDGMAQDEEQRSRYLEIIRAKSDLLQQRIYELIEFAGMATNDWKRNFAPVDMSDLLAEAADLFDRECRVTGRVFTIDADLPGPALVMGDRTMLFRALENVLENARRYSPEGSTIQLTAGVEAGKDAQSSLRISIEDSGPGIPENEREDVFRFFYRGESSRNTPGTGLGLTSMSSVIRTHGGDVSLDHSSLGGARFTVTLPLILETENSGPVSADYPLND